MVGFSYCLFLTLLTSASTSIIKKQVKVIHKGTTYTGIGEVDDQENAVNLLTICGEIVQVSGILRGRVLQKPELLELLKSHIGQRRIFAEGHRSIAVFLERSSNDFEKIQVLNGLAPAALGISYENKVEVSIPYQHEQYVNLYLELGKKFTEMHKGLCLPQEDVATMNLAPGSKLIEISVKDWSIESERTFITLLSNTSVHGFVESNNPSSNSGSDFRPVRMAIKSSRSRQYIYVEYLFKTLEALVTIGDKVLLGYLKSSEDDSEIWFTENTKYQLKDGSVGGVASPSTLFSPSSDDKVYLLTPTIKPGEFSKWGKEITNTKLTKLYKDGKTVLTILSYSA